MLVRRLLDYARLNVEQNDNFDLFSDTVVYSHSLLLWNPFVEDDVHDLIEFMVNQAVLKAFDLKEEFTSLLSTCICSTEEILRSFGLKICKKLLKLKIQADERDFILGALLNLQESKELSSA